MEAGMLEEVRMPEPLPSIRYFLIRRKNDSLSATASLLLDEL